MAPKVRDVAPKLRRAGCRARVQMCRGQRLPSSAQGVCCRVFLAPGPRAQRAPLPRLALEARVVCAPRWPRDPANLSCATGNLWRVLASVAGCTAVAPARQSAPGHNAGVAAAHRSKDNAVPKPRWVRARGRMRACVHGFGMCVRARISGRGHTHTHTPVAPEVRVCGA